MWQSQWQIQVSSFVDFKNKHSGSLFIVPFVKKEAQYPLKSSVSIKTFLSLRFDQTTVEMHFAEVKMGIVSLG